MTPDTEELFQSLGSLLLDMTDEDSARILLYAEAEDGSASADVFFLDHSGRIVYKYASEDVVDVVFALWQAWPDDGPNSKWATLAYLIDNGKFTIDLQYPEQIDMKADSSVRRPDVLLKYFGTTTVDYSNPGD